MQMVLLTPECKGRPPPTVDGTTVNPQFLKAGDVKQFGQVSGYNFDSKLETS